jgi:hypothetical protein
MHIKTGARQHQSVKTTDGTGTDNADTWAGG